PPSAHGIPPSFPTRRSSDLRHLLYRLLAYRLQADRLGDLDAGSKRALERLDTVRPSGRASPLSLRPPLSLKPGTVLGGEWNGQIDRKSTRLNSSHQIISYAV